MDSKPSDVGGLDEQPLFEWYVTEGPVCERMMFYLVILLRPPLVATLIALFDKDGSCGQDRRWQYS